MHSKNILIIAAFFIFPTHPLHAQTFQDFLNRVFPAPPEQRQAMVDSFMNTAKNFPYLEQDTLAHFIYRGEASRAAVAGDFNSWNPDAASMQHVPSTDFWFRNETFEPDARLDYKFVIDGNTWILDPLNPNTISGGFGPNSELSMPGYVPPPEIEFYPDIPHGTLQDTTFSSTSLGNSRKIQIYLPPGYNTSARRYPLILFHDGLEYISLAKANNVFDYLIQQQRIEPVLAVFVPPVNRSREYAGNLKPQFTAFIVDELLPWVDRRFRTRTGMHSRATLGASNGGNIALWLGLQHPEVFGHIAAQSSNVEAAIARGFQNRPKSEQQFYLDIGTYDIPLLIPRVKTFVPVLQAKGYPVIFREFHEGHSWGNWRAHLDDVLELFFPPQPTGIGEKEKPVPAGFALLGNYPNPFHPNTRLRYRLGETAHIRIEVFDILGHAITTLIDRETPAGEHSIAWDGRRTNGQTMPSGIYLYQIHLNGRPLQTGRMVLLRE